ncbi:MAG: ATP-dependent DNA helicase [Nanohaloarchaea archaeon SW_7_43_1]|nr:MAG: ATP-dependent DNA helicase [Nanohaloarchaea archaeon SW_7_43_1]
MTEEFSPNQEQQELIESMDGIYKVDAGAGTGKTFTITRRYAHILEQEDVEPEDILLLTFTDNAADEMKERIINHCSYDMKALREAPISTFHSLAKKIIIENGFEAPKYLGIDDHVTSSTRLLENEVLEKQEFRQFINSFIERNPQYNKIYRVLYDYEELLSLIKSLAAKGIVPTEEGWYRNSEKYLDGDFDKFQEVFEEMNEPGEGSRGPTQSDFLNKAGGIFRDKCLPEDAPGYSEVKESKQIGSGYAEEAFQQNREELKHFIHDIYFEYLKYCLSQNYLNFNFLLVFAYALLCEDDELRQELSFNYSMIDEFQDTNEIQFKVAMLLSEGNIAVVGDWKQSIYSFQYANVDNIREFRERLQKYKKELNQEQERINYPVDDVERIDLKKNYRSTQEILDFSEDSLTLPGKDGEEVEEKDIVSLGTNKEEFNTSITKLKSENELEVILHKIQEIIGNPDYSLEEEDRPPEYDDIAILTRNRNFGLELQEKAEEYGIPVAYEGGVELFKTKPAIILLAWLRVLNYRESKKGWAVILEEAGYKLAETEHILEKEEYPEEMMKFRSELDKLDDVSSVSRKVFSRYGIENGFSNKVIQVLQDTLDSSYKNLGDLIRFIEECIEEGETYEVDDSKPEAVTVQTIHSAKGLEYPIVFISDINRRHFPSNQGSSSRIIYEDPVGLRQKKIYSEEKSYLYDNWKASLVSKVLTGDYDEERRLMYVAMTRAEQYLFFTAENNNESPFFEHLNLETKKLTPELEKTEFRSGKGKELEVDELEEKASVKRSVHAVMELDETTGGRGPEFGTKVHEFAEKYANGEDVEPDEEIKEDTENVIEFIDSLDGELRTEVPIKIPVGEDGRKVVYHGVIDLLHIKDNKVEIIDWKTDLTKVNNEEYQKQLKIYEKGINEIFDEKEVEKGIFYSAQ